MNDLTFQEGQNNIKVIYFPNGDSINANGDNEEIKVIMEYGQMAGVPWFGLFENGVLKSKWNAAMCEGVNFK